MLKRWLYTLAAAGIAALVGAASAHAATPRVLVDIRARQDIRR